MTYRIGEFARLAGVTSKTLRFYEECGLLRPARVDARTRYRYYEPRQLRDLAMARAFRAAGLPLAQIKRLMSGSISDSQRRAALERLHVELQASLRQTGESLRWIAALLASQPSDMPTSPVLIKQRREVLVASLRAEVDDYAEMQRLERELVRRVPQGARGAFQGVLWHRCAADGRPDGEPVIELVRRSASSREYASRALPAMLVATAYSTHDDADAERTYARLHEWTHLAGYTLDGPKCEIAHDDVLEIQFPIARAWAPASLHCESAA